MTRIHRVGIFAAAAVVGVAATLAVLVLAGVGGEVERPATRVGPTASGGPPLRQSRPPRQTERASTTPVPSRTGRPRPPASTVTPRTNRPAYVFPIAGCRVDYAAEHHDYPATDMFAARGCAFVSPVAGVVDEVGLADRWAAATNRGADRGGRFVAVVGDDGVRYYGSHLESVEAGIRPGVRVAAGTTLGGIGDSGSAAGTGTHLHFGISWPTGPDHWWVRRGAVPPAPYLDAWRAGGAGSAASPAAAVSAAEEAAGDWSRCRTYC